MAERFIVPDEFMMPVGAAWTKRLGKCADSWTDSEIAMMRSELPQRYHAVPLDGLRRRWINIRKKGTDGYRLNGKGPAKGSRKKPKRSPPPKWYQDYISRPHFTQLRDVILRGWDYRCAVCYTHQDESVIDIHHRTYVRLHHERKTDLIPLCRHCHDLFHDAVEIPTQESAAEVSKY